MIVLVLVVVALVYGQSFLLERSICVEVRTLVHSLLVVVAVAMPIRPPPLVVALLVALDRLRFAIVWRSRRPAVDLIAKQ